MHENIRPESAVSRVPDYHARRVDMVNRSLTTCELLEDNEIIGGREELEFWIAKRYILTYRTNGGEIRIPVFQFTESRCRVPFISEVLRRIRPDADPVEVIYWFTTPNPKLAGGKNAAPISPREWLLGGHNVNTIIEHIHEI